MCFAFGLHKHGAHSRNWGAPHAGKIVPTQGPQHHGAHRDSGGADHLSDDGLHSLRQPQHARRNRHGQGRGICCHLPGGGDRLGHHGPGRQLPDRPGAGHGPERLLHLHRGADHGPHLAGGTGRGVPLRGDLLSAVDLQDSRVDHQQHPHGAARRDCRRHWPVPGDHRAEKRRHRGGQPCHPGRPRRPAAKAARCWPAWVSS